MHELAEYARRFVDVYDTWALVFSHLIEHADTWLILLSGAICCLLLLLCCSSCALFCSGATRTRAPSSPLYSASIPPPTHAQPQLMSVESHNADQQQLTPYNVDQLQQFLPAHCPIIVLQLPMLSMGGFSQRPAFFRSRGSDKAFIEEPSA